MIPFRYLLLLDVSLSSTPLLTSIVIALFACILIVLEAGVVGISP